MAGGFLTFTLDAATTALLERIDRNQVVILERLNSMESNLSREVGEMAATVDDFISFATAEITRINAALQAAIADKDEAGQLAAAAELDSAQQRMVAAKAALQGTPAPTPTPTPAPTPPPAG